MRILSKNMRMKEGRKIALLYPASVPWFARFMDGVRRYVRENDLDWRLFSSPPSLHGTAESVLSVRSLEGWKRDGVILASNDKRELLMARKMKIPMVNLAAGLADSHGIPRVMVNHYRAGQMAADHLLGQGLRNLAFFGWKDLYYSEQRQSGFADQAAKSGAGITSFLQSADNAERQNWSQWMADITRWLRQLPKPVGIFAVHDYRAQLLIEACQEMPLRVPDDVAVIGMDNDEIVCEHSIPTLTSISRNSERVGWETATLLDRLIEGQLPARGDVLVEPDSVVVRQSTDMLYCADPITRRALDYMMENLKTQFNVTHLAEYAGVSKRTLEMRFRAETGTSPHDYLSRLRVKRAQALLQLPQKRTIEQVALECGFGTTPTFYATFHRVTGKTPAGFKRDIAAAKTAGSMH
jgi:LacI family transcriptional regulator